MSTVVTLPYDPVWRAVEWAKENCPSYITNDVEPIEPDATIYTKRPRPNIRYYFGDERDAFWFRLRWA